MEEPLEPQIPESPQEAAPVPRKRGFFSRHSKAIAAWTAVGSFVTTAVLALFAYLSLSEVQKQRDLAFKQFVVANAPSVRTYVQDGFRFENNYAVMVWKATNQGGPVSDVVYKSVVVCCGADIKKASDSEVIIRTSHVDRLDGNEGSSIKILVANDDTIKWLKALVESKKENPFLFLYLRAEYTIPPELSLTGKSRRESTYRLCVWEPHRNGFENMRADYEKVVLPLLEERGYLTMEDRG